MRRIFILILALILVGGLSFYLSFRYVDSRYKKNPENNSKIEEVKEEPITEEISETALDSELIETNYELLPIQEESFPYYLVEEYGFVNIYLTDKKTIYEFTEIKIDELPQELQDEICTGKGLASEQELYDFLENYSS